MLRLSGTSGFAIFMTGLPFTTQQEVSEDTNEGISISIVMESMNAQLEAQQGQPKFSYRNPSSGEAKSVNDVGCELTMLEKALRIAFTEITP